MQVEARMLVVARVYGDGGEKTPTIQQKNGPFESQVSFRLGADLALLGLLEREITVEAASDIPTPEECRNAAAQQLLQYAPGQFSVPKPSILPDYTTPGVLAHVWIEALNKWVRQGGGLAFGAAFEVHSGASSLVRPAKVYNGGTLIDLCAGVLLVVQSRNL